jgi:predicted O-methyltransferase YrrM
MSRRTLNLSNALYEYLLAETLREHPVQHALRGVTAKQPRSGMQISPEQGQFMGLMVRLVGARRAIEIGTFTGYSALAIALALPADGTLICCDINPDTTAIAREHWNKAGVAAKIDLRIGPALATIDALLAGGMAGQFDLAFIDADKSAYDAYYEGCLRLIRPGGLIMIDNVLWGGSVADPSDRETSTQAIRTLNAKINADERVDMCLLPIGDGLMLARKR